MTEDDRMAESSARNRALSTRYYEAWNSADLRIPDEIFAETFFIHDPGSPVTLVMGPDGVKGRITDYRAAFPDLKIEVEDVVAEGDRVVTRWTLRATHLGSFAGFAATGGRIEVEGITIHRAAGGLIVEAWVNWDTLSLRRQLQGE